MPRSFTYLYRGVAMYVQISRTLSPQRCAAGRRPPPTPPTSLASPPCSVEVAEEVLPLPPQPEKVMRFRAPSITRRMRNLIIKERHVAVRKICLFGGFSPPLLLLLPSTFIVSPRETKVTPVLCSLNLASSNLSR